MRDLKYLGYFENLLREANNELIVQAKKDGKVCVAFVCENTPEPLMNLDGTFSIRLSAPNTGSMDNDTCYPAILIIGQFMRAILSGKYDPHKVALVMFQTGGGCRASNYISLLRKALKKAGYGYVPVISFSLAGIEDHPGFKLTLPKLHGMLYAVIYGDLLLSLVNIVGLKKIPVGRLRLVALAPDNVKTHGCSSCKNRGVLFSIPRCLSNCNGGFCQKSAGKFGYFSLRKSGFFPFPEPPDVV